MTPVIDEMAINLLLNQGEPDPQDPDTWQPPPLEEVQEHAAFAPEGPLVILGGAGTGKSHTLLARAVGLARAGAPPGTICIITFNARASHRIQQQLSQIIGGDPAEAGFFIGTLHAYCSATLRQAGWKYCGILPSFSIWDQDQSLANLEQIVTEDNPDQPSPLMPNELARLLDWINRNACLPEAEHQPAPDASWLRYAESYQYQKRAQNSLDFTDLLVMTRDAFRQNSQLRNAYNSIRSRHLIPDCGRVSRLDPYPVRTRQTDDRPHHVNHHCAGPEPVHLPLARRHPGPVPAVPVRLPGSVALRPVHQPSHRRFGNAVLASALPERPDDRLG